MEQEEIDINGFVAILSYDKQRNVHTLIVPMLESVIMIRGQLSENDITKIAERINFMQKH